MNSNHAKFSYFEQEKNMNSKNQETYFIGGFKHNKKMRVMGYKL